MITSLSDWLFKENKMILILKNFFLTEGFTSQNLESEMLIYVEEPEALDMTQGRYEIMSQNYVIYERMAQNVEM